MGSFLSSRWHYSAVQLKLKYSRKHRTYVDYTLFFRYLIKAKIQTTKKVKVSSATKAPDILLRVSFVQRIFDVRF